MRVGSKSVRNALITSCVVKVGTSLGSSPTTSVPGLPEGAFCFKVVVRQEWRSDILFDDLYVVLA